jgi:hypothetical protein
VPEEGKFGFGVGPGGSDGWATVPGRVRGAGRGLDVEADTRVWLDYWLEGEARAEERGPGFIWSNSFLST